jgi:hypothetical protein
MAPNLLELLTSVVIKSESRLGWGFHAQIGRRLLGEAEECRQIPGQGYLPEERRPRGLDEACYWFEMLTSLPAERRFVALHKLGRFGEDSGHPANSVGAIVQRY